MPIQKDLVSEAAQTLYCDSETQFLEWDVSKNPTINPNNFYRGIGLHYRVLFDPAWPIHIAHKRKENKNAMKVGSNLVEKKKLVPKNYALTGMTLGDDERQPIKRTLLFPHRNTEAPFKQHSIVDVRDPIFELCEKLTLQDINEIETRIIFKSILNNLSNYDKTNKEARMKALQKLLNIHSKPQDKAPPSIKQRRKSKWGQNIEDKLQNSPLVNEKDELENIPKRVFVNDGPKCPIHGFQKYICRIHNVEEIEEQKENYVSKGEDEKNNKNDLDEDWCRMCSGRNLDRQVYGEDHSSYLPSPPKSNEQEINKEISKEKETKKARGIWCSICKGFDFHRKVYEWPLRKEKDEKEENENENEYSDEDDADDWCPMCQGYKVHRKLYGEDYNDYPNPPYKDPTKDKNYKGIYCVWCKGYNIHRQVYDWPSLG